jgi:hypothetical protein
VNCALRVTCIHCGWNTHAPHGSTIDAEDAARCPECGHWKGESNGLVLGWEVVLMRWHSTVVWWKPWTWCSGEWRKLTKDEWVHRAIEEFCKGQ